MVTLPQKWIIFCVGLFVGFVMGSYPAHAQLNAGNFESGRYLGQFSYAGLTGDVSAIIAGNLQGSSGTFNATMTTPWVSGFSVCEYSNTPDLSGCNYDYPANGPNNSCLPNGPPFAPYFCRQIGGTQNLCKETLSGTWSATSHLTNGYLVTSAAMDLSVTDFGTTGGVCPPGRPAMIHIYLTAQINTACDIGYAGSGLGICDENFDVMNPPSNAGTGVPIGGHLGISYDPD